MDWLAKRRRLGSDRQTFDHSALHPPHDGLLQGLLAIDKAKANLLLKKEPPLDDEDAAADDLPREDDGRVAGAAPDGPASLVTPGAEPEIAVEHDTQPTPIRASKRRARTSVPSWDDIMFGTKRD